MAQPKQPTLKRPEDKVPIEPGYEKRLANILKKALNTPPSRKQVSVSDERAKRDKPKSAR